MKSFITFHLICIFLLFTACTKNTEHSNENNDSWLREVEVYAAEHYQWWDFMQWWNTLTPALQDTFSHRMPWNEEDRVPIKNMEYYEYIGVYDQFQIGWDDIDQYPPGIPNGVTVMSPHREFYLELWYSSQ